MSLLSHMRGQSHTTKRVAAQVVALGFGAVLISVWVKYTFFTETEFVTFPDTKTPFSILSNGVDDMTASVMHGFDIIKKKQ